MPRRRLPAGQQVVVVLGVGVPVGDERRGRGQFWPILWARREQLTRHAAICFGDVFEYLRRGQVAGAQPGTIARRVADRLDAAARVARQRQEPLVLVTPSFGSASADDLLTSPLSAVPSAFKDLRVDRWVMAGSQASVLAEIRAYLGSPGDVAPIGLLKATIRQAKGFARSAV